MFNDLMLALSGKKKRKLSMEDIARILEVNPKCIEQFEEAYRKQALQEEAENDNLFKINAKQASKFSENEEPIEQVEEMIETISDDLAAKTMIWNYKNKKSELVCACETTEMTEHVTQEDINMLPEQLRPQLTSELMMVDINTPSYIELLDEYQRFVKAKNKKEKELWYHHFRQGLDILDLDYITYKMLEQNKNTMGYWLPAITNAVEEGNFFKIPNTTIVKVPMTLLQLTRCDYFALTPTTKAIVDRWAMKVFGLDEEKEYFIKTGTYSSKFDFRNARVRGAQEVRELGEYLLFIHFQALQMASPLSTPSIYGVSTTNEWVVREFIQDKEENPCIYNGLPLHTEYRIFVDFDKDTILGINPYWDPNVMKNRFMHSADSDTAQNKHDGIIYMKHEKELMRRYEENKSRVVSEIQKIIPNIDLEGQWSMDIMQNGDDFWLIDMADAANSALSFCVPDNLLKKNKEEWLPLLTDMKEK